MNPADGRTGAILAPRRGRVLLPIPASAHAKEIAHGDAWRTLAFLVLLPLFGETFQYIVDTPLLYRLAKGWPLLTLPLAAWGVARLDLPYKAPLLLACGWTLGVTPLLGVWQLGNLIGGALASTLKVWALSYGFSAAAALALLRPSPRGLARIVVALGVLTFVALVVIWALAPPEAYFRTIQETKIFLYDEERGNRVNVPMFLGLLSIFTLARSFWARPGWKQPTVLAVFFFLMLTLFKERLPILGSVLVIGLGAILSNRKWRWPWLVGVVALASLALPAYLAIHGDQLADSLGGSLTYRRQELQDAFAFLDAEPWRWITGVGSATRIGDVTLADLVGSKYFFLADLGWLGVVFEYGLVGAALLMAVLLCGLVLTWRAVRPEEPLSGGCFDYLLYVLLTSPVSSVVMAPGEALTCMAIAWYLTVHRNEVRKLSGFQSDGRRS